MVACEEPPDAAGAREVDLSFVAPGPRLARLTESQFENSVHEIFGVGVVLTSGLDPDSRVRGSVSVGARESSMSRYGVQ